MITVREMAERAREASRQLGQASAAQKNAALLAMADAICRAESEILRANSEDIVTGRARGMSEAVQSRRKG